MDRKEKRKPGFVWSDGNTWKDGDPNKRDRMEKYMEWLLVPTSERNPSSKAKLAEQLGVTTQTLRNYGKEPQFQSELRKRSRTLNRVERASDVLDTLFQTATDKTNPRSVQAAKVWLEWINDNSEDATLPADLEDISDEELESLLIGVAKRRKDDN